MADVTQLLSEIEQGDPMAADRLLPLVYDELRKLAAARLGKERPGQTLQPTALVHEAYMRLVDVNVAQHWDSVGHFYAAAAEAMRRILIENARRKQSLKAGGHLQRVELGDAQESFHTSPEDLLDLDAAIAKLQADDPAAAALAKLRLFAGLNVDEAAAKLGISRASGFRHWTYARAYLQAELGGEDQADPAIHK